MLRHKSTKKVPSFQEIFELSHDGRQTKADSVTRFDTEDCAVMNLAVAGYEKEAAQTNYVAVGQNGKCQVYKLTMAREKGRTHIFVQYYITYMKLR